MGVGMDLEFTQLDLRYKNLRRNNSNKERRLLASLSECGQQMPVVVVGGNKAGIYVLLDGYKRVRALKKLKHDLVRVTIWDLDESDGLLLERLMRTSESDGALEQGWFLDELNDRFDLSHEELARRFDKSQSWVSRRLALVRDLPKEVRKSVQSGKLPAHSAMKFLVPMARAKRDDCIRLVAALGKLQPSTRDMEALYTTWVRGDKKTRELVVTKPEMVLKAREHRALEESSPNTPGRQLLDDFGILVGTSRRARTKLVQGLINDLLPTETEQAQSIARQARTECNALFRSAASLLKTPDKSERSLSNAQSPQQRQQQQEETND